VAGPPGFEPGTPTQDQHMVAWFFSGGFPKVLVPRGKSITDAYIAPPMLYLTELRARSVRIPDVIKSVLHGFSPSQCFELGDDTKFSCCLLCSTRDIQNLETRAGLGWVREE
jgi:hypothetical protein